MKSSDLHTLWSAPDNSRVTTKQFSFRLPVHVAAKIAAIGEMYPHKSRTEIVSDLLSSALDDFEKSLPTVEGGILHILPDGEEIRDDIGPRRDFWKIADKHYMQIEKEMGNDNPVSLRESTRQPKSAESDE